MHLQKQSVTAVHISDPLRKIERCARICYKSEDSITPTSAGPFVKRIVDRGHTATLECWCCTFKLTSLAHLVLVSYCSYAGFKYFNYTKTSNLISGNLRAWYELVNVTPVNDHLVKTIVTRINNLLFEFVGPELFTYKEESFFCAEVAAEANNIQYMGESDDYITFDIITNLGISPQLIRHRTLSPMQESTRYVRYSGEDISVLSSIELLPDVTSAEKTLKDTANDIWTTTMKTSFAAYDQLLFLGVPPQIARGVLPRDMCTNLILTATYTAWERFIKLRDSKAAHQHCQEIAHAISLVLDGIKTGRKTDVTNN